MTQDAKIIAMPSMADQCPYWGLGRDIAKVVEAYSAAYQCHSDIPLAAVLTILGVAAGKNAVLEVPPYTVRPNLQTITVARSGANKTAPTAALLQPLRDAEAASYVEYRAARDAYDGLAGKPPRWNDQLIISDITPEALTDALAHDHHGKLAYVDEMVGYIRSLGRYGGSADAEMRKMMTIYDGGDIAINRKGEGATVVRAPWLAMLGGVQPGQARAMMAQPLLESGWSQRWLYLAPTDTPPPNRWMVGAVPIGVNKLWYSKIADLLAMPPTTYTLSPDAAEYYRVWATELDVQATEAIDDAEASACAKAVILCLKLAIIGQLADEPANNVIDAPCVIWAGHVARYSLDGFARLRADAQSGARLGKSGVVAAILGYCPSTSPTKIAELFPSGKAVSRQLVYDVLTMMGRKPAPTE